MLLRFVLRWTQPCTHRLSPGAGWKNLARPCNNANNLNSEKLRRTSNNENNLTSDRLGFWLNRLPLTVLLHVVSHVYDWLSFRLLLFLMTSQTHKWYFQSLPSFRVGNCICAMIVFLTDLSETRLFGTCTCPQMLHAHICIIKTYVSLMSHCLLVTRMGYLYSIIACR